MTITWWHNSNTDPGKGYYETVAKDFQASHPGVTIQVSAMQHEDMLTKLDAAFQTQDGDAALLAYAQSYVGARILAERLGPNFPVFLQYLSNGTSMEQALLLFNLSAADMEREWTRRARAAR